MPGTVDSRAEQAKKDLSIAETLLQAAENELDAAIRSGDQAKMAAANNKIEQRTRQYNLRLTEYKDALTTSNNVAERDATRQDTTTNTRISTGGRILDTILADNSAARRQNAQDANANTRAQYEQNSANARGMWGAQNDVAQSNARNAQAAGLAEYGQAGREYDTALAGKNQLTNSIFNDTGESNRTAAAQNAANMREYISALIRKDETDVSLAGEIFKAYVKELDRPQPGSYIANMGPGSPGEQLYKMSGWNYNPNNFKVTGRPSMDFEQIKTLLTP